MEFGGVVVSALTLPQKLLHSRQTQTPVSWFGGARKRGMQLELGVWRKGVQCGVRWEFFFGGVRGGAAALLRNSSGVPAASPPACGFTALASRRPHRSRPVPGGRSLWREREKEMVQWNQGGVGVQSGGK